MGWVIEEAKASTVSKYYFIIKDLQYFLSQTDLNKESFKAVMKDFEDEKAFMIAFIDFLDDKIKASANMAIFISTHKTVTFQGERFYLFYPSGSTTRGDELFKQNIFSVVQEMPYIFKYENKKRFSFRPDLTFFVNGFYLGYSELKSNWNSQSARQNGRQKVAKDYLSAVEAYLEIAKDNDISKTIRRDFLKIFEKAIHITSTDLRETYIIRNMASYFDEIKTIVEEKSYNFNDYNKRVLKEFKPYPLLERTEEERKKITLQDRFEEIFRTLYSKKMIEKEILYYNFLERELIKKPNSKSKEYKHNDGRLICPRPKQKFGTDKIIAKIDEFLEHENEPDYFINKLRKELKKRKVGKEKSEELIEKRLKYQNNKYVYSLLLQYAAGFGKSNIIGWTALQLKDLRKNDAYVYDKIILVVDRLQLRDQLDSKLHNMNIQKGMFIEAHNKKSFEEALSSSKRIVVVNIQKFMSVKNILDKEGLEKLAQLRIAFLIDEIHRSNTGLQHEEMISVFDELQSSFDKDENSKSEEKAKKQYKKNLIIGFTATPSDHTLARFGEYNKYAEAEKIWIPFDSYTMRQAIEDGYILNPLNGVVPVSAKMFFELPESDFEENELEGFQDDTSHKMGYETIPENTDTGVDEEGKKYAIRKKEIYENTDRIEAISKFIVERLVSAIYPTIRGRAKAMLAVSSIKAATQYKRFISDYYSNFVKQKKHERFKDAPIYIVYSDSQDHLSSSSLNDGVKEKTVLQNFKFSKNGLIIVVDKLQTGFDEPKLHTLFLDKEIKGINAIQTISESKPNYKA